MNFSLSNVLHSLWTKSFLADWWGFADRKLYSDQEQFDMLLTYRQKHFLNNSSSNLHIGYYLGGRLAILPPDAINTDPPAMTQHQLHNPVVHLMGEHSNLRIKAFSSAHSEQCRQAYSAAHFHNCTNFFCKIISAKFPNLANQSLLLAPQLSVTKDNLLVWTLEVYSVESELLLRNFATVVHSYHVGLNGSYCDEIDLSDMKRLSNAVHHFAHALEYSANKEIRAFYRQKMINQAMGLRKWVYQLLRKHYTNLLLLIKKKSLIEKFCHSIAVDWPEIIKTVSTAGQHLLGSPLISINTRLEIADELNRDMEDMLKSSDRQQHNAIYQMKVHLILQMGLLHLEQSSQTVSNSNLKALELFLKALSLSEEVAKVSGDHTLVTPLELAANLLATTGRHEEAFSMYQRALDISEKHLGSQHNGRTLLYINFGMSMIEKAHDLKIESGCSEKSVNLAISGLSALTTAKKLLKKKEGMANDMSARISVFVAMAGDLIISCE